MNLGEASSATRWMRAASALEVLTGLGLVLAPSLLSRLLFGSGMDQIGDSVGRIAGLVMICLAAACWPRGSEGDEARALGPLMALSVLAALYLIAVGVGGATVGVVLWPAAALHLILAVLLAQAWMNAPAAE